MKIKFQTIKDVRGKLTVCENIEGSLPFIPLRTFFISEVDPTQERAGHSVSCDLVILPLKGSLKVEIFEKGQNIIHELQDHSTGLFIPKKTFITLKAFKKDSLIVVFASKLFKDTEIRDLP